MRARGPGRPGTLGEPFGSVLAAARTGAPWAFERLWQSLGPVVAGYLRLQGAPEPDDLTSEVFLSVFTSLGSFEGDEDRFRSWVFTIAHRRLVDDWRRRGRRPALADGGEQAERRAAQAPGGDVEEEALRRLSEDRVRRICERLAPDQRDVILLRMVAGMSLEQTAEAVGKTTIAVKALQHRGVAALRRLLEREGVSL
ncbi:MAG TPA: sigma-70 family RNA polymerase sigma factor [Acidimicrobiales bacterium]|nr:sigma-70 family RNA polymerase sigma factor [Acidimicrobiales bacterium]